MTKLTIKYQIITVDLSRWRSAFHGLFSNNPNLLKRDTYPSAKLQIIPEIWAIMAIKKRIQHTACVLMFS